MNKHIVDKEVNETTFDIIQNIGGDSEVVMNLK